MVDVNTCALIARPTPLPPQKNAHTKLSIFIIVLITFIVEFLHNYHHNCDHPNVWCNWEYLFCNISLPEAMIGKQFLSSPMQVLGAFGLQVGWQGEWRRVMVHWSHPATLPPCHPPAICPNLLAAAMIHSHFTPCRMANYPAPPMIQQSTNQLFPLAPLQ